LTSLQSATARYSEMLKYNALCVISDGVNNRAGSLFASYDFFYAWRKTDGSELKEVDGINSLYTMVRGMFNQERLVDIIRNFIFFPDTAKEDIKIVCRYPQYYAAGNYSNRLRRICAPKVMEKAAPILGPRAAGKVLQCSTLPACS